MFCKIYVTFKDISVDEVFNLIASYFGKSNSDQELEFRKSILSVRLNEDYNKEKEVDFPDGFLFFKVLIEIEIFDDDLKEIKTMVREILHLLWAKKYAAVAACPFEHDLPLSGGYRQKELPWPEGPL